MDQRPNRMQFAIGEFSKLTGIPKQTLQFYDKIGIFSPAVKQENGYRYYEAEQYEAVDIIYSLKEAGLPLKEIKHYLDNRTPEVCLELLEQESKRIRDKIKYLQRALAMVEQKKASTIRGLQAEISNEVRFEDKMEAHLFTWDFREVDDAGFMVELIHMVNWCYDNGYYTGYAMGSIVDQSALESGTFNRISHMFLTAEKAIDHANYRHRQAGTYAIYNYKGSYDGVPVIYPSIMVAIQAAGYTVVGDSYETGLLDFFSVRKLRII